MEITKNKKRISIGAAVVLAAIIGGVMLSHSPQGENAPAAASMNAQEAAIERRERSDADAGAALRCGHVSRVRGDESARFGDLCSGDGSRPSRRYSGSESAD